MPGDKKVINITIPTKCGEKGKHCAHESFKDTYQKMLDFKTRSISIPMKIEGEWQTSKLVKALLYPLMQLKSDELITVILYSSDPSRCEMANNVINVARRGKNMFFSSPELKSQIEHF